MRHDTFVAWGARIVFTFDDHRVDAVGDHREIRALDLERERQGALAVDRLDAGDQHQRGLAHPQPSRDGAEIVAHQARTLGAQAAPFDERHGLRVEELDPALGLLTRCPGVVLAVEVEATGANSRAGAEARRGRCVLGEQPMGHSVIEARSARHAMALRSNVRHHGHR